MGGCESGCVTKTNNNRGAHNFALLNIRIVCLLSRRRTCGRIYKHTSQDRHSGVPFGLSVPTPEGAQFRLLNATGSAKRVGAQPTYPPLSLSAPSDTVRRPTYFPPHSPPPLVRCTLQNQLLATPGKSATPATKQTFPATTCAISRAVSERRKKLRARVGSCSAVQLSGNY